MKLNYNLKQNKKRSMFFKLLFSLFLGFIFGNYMLFSGNLDNFSTKLLRLFAYESIKTNVLKYDINYREYKWKNIY